MDYQTIKENIDKQLLFKGYSEVEILNFEVVEELEQYYKSQGFKATISRGIEKHYILEIRFKNK